MFRVLERSTGEPLGEAVRSREVVPVRSVFDLSYCEIFLNPCFLSEACCSFAGEMKSMNKQQHIFMSMWPMAMCRKHMSEQLTHRGE